MLLPTAYFPNIEYFWHLYHSKIAEIDFYEPWQKQTFRNRSYILTANGVQMISVPVERPFGKETTINQVLISNKEDWRKDHIGALTSAYKRTPYFEFYWDDLQALLNHDHDTLIALNFSLTHWLVEKIGLSCEIKFTDQIKDLEPNDLRAALHPKKETSFKCYPYLQTFTEKFGFENNLSVLDLLFNEGPNSISILQESGS